MNLKETKSLLDDLVLKFNNPAFITDDPISIPHRFSRKEDIEISGFLASTIAWGNRKSIIKSSLKMMDLMSNEPYNFVLNASNKEKKNLLSFVHRTFNGGDFLFFIESLKNIYVNHKGLQKVFADGYSLSGDVQGSLKYFRTIFFEIEHEKRSEKHVSDITKKAAAKRLNMYLRWMVRKDNSGVDFGIWNDIPMSKLLIPLDVHSATVARKLGLLNRKQNDINSVLELTNVLSQFDNNDPVKYDFALFGAGVSRQI